MEKTDQGIISHLLVKRVFGLFFDSPNLLNSLFAHSKLHSFNLMTAFFCVTLHGDSDWNAENMHRGGLQAT